MRRSTAQAQPIAGLVPFSSSKSRPFVAFSMARVGVLFEVAVTRDFHRKHDDALGRPQQGPHALRMERTARTIEGTPRCQFVSNRA